MAATGERCRRERNPVSVVEEVGPMSAMDGCCPGHNKWLFRVRHPVSVSVETEDRPFGHVTRLRMTNDRMLC